MRTVLFIIALFSGFTASSQAVITFATRSHDFGTIQEVNGAVSYNFQFTNTGTAPILVKNVESSCGCTSPEWSKQPILPGKTGYVKATFDPKDRPGFFDKTITVYSNARTPVVELKIKGTVQGKARTVLDDYPYELASGLRLPLEEISFMKARKGDVKSMSIGVFNNAGKPVTVAFANLPAHIRLAMEPAQIGNKEKAVIKASYNTAAHGAYGLNRENVTLVVDGKKYPLPVSIFIEEDFKAVDRATAPLADADKKYHNFGATPAATPATFTFQVKNTGKTPLKMHRFYTNDPRVEASMTAKEIAPGQSAPLTVKTVAGAEPGKVTAMVSVITNSPAASELKIRFYGEIK